MIKMVIQELGVNAALLIVLSFSYIQVLRRTEGTRVPGRVLSGVLFGTVAIGVMLIPLHLFPGVVFDTRSVVISVGGLFGGPIVAAITFALASAYRIWLGGVGAFTGVLVVAISAGLGAAFHYLYKRRRNKNNSLFFYLFGVLVHLLMLLCMLSLPWPLAWKVLVEISLPVIIIYPMASLFLCLLISDRESQITADRLLKENEEKYRRIVDTANEGVWEINESLQTTFVNRKMAEMLGYAPEEIIGKKLEAFIYPEDLAKFNIRMDTPSRFDRARIERRYVRKDGKPIWFLVSVAPIMDDKDSLSGSFAMLTDITDLKTAEEALQESEDQKRIILDGLPDRIRRVDNNMNVLWANKTARTMHPDILGQTCHKAVVNKDEPCDGCPCKKSLETGQIEMGIKYHPKMTGLSGATYWESIGVPLKNDIGEVVGAIAIARDITARMQAEEALVKSQATINSIYKASPIGIGTVNADRVIGWASDSLARMTGYTVEELMEMPARQLYESQEEYERVAREKHAAVRLGGVGSVETRFRRKDGTIMDLILSSSQINPNDFDAGLVFTTLDISGRKKLEFQLHHAYKMEAIGTLAGGIAHDFNNILAAITGYAELTLDDAIKGKAAPADIREILKAAGRAKELVQQILTFSRKVAFEQKPLNLNRVISDTVTLIERTIPKMISVELYLDQDLQLINGDSNQIEQVLLNLAANAKDAMPIGGKLIFETDKVTLDQKYIKGHHGAPPGDYVLVTVSDTGEGMDRDTLEHIFDPFYTTKEVGKGTGLGLASAYGIVKSHGGYITCYSEPGTGTTFKMYLPTLKSDEKPSPAVKADVDLILGGTETILLVDDEETLREVGSRVMQSMGYRVMTASTGEEAFDIYHANSRQVDLVILDLGMPGMGGHKALKAILSVSPEAKVVIASGYSAHGKLKDTLKSGAAGYIAKPFTRAKLLETVREVLDG